MDESSVTLKECKPSLVGYTRDQLKELVSQDFFDIPEKQRSMRVSQLWSWIYTAAC